jgi:DUF4097 and DUF4098 domain-containing protein YvlB
VVISNNNGSVKASEIGRDVKVRNSFATVSVEKVHGGVDVENQNGSITVADLPTAPCRPVILRTSHATIKVEVSPEASYAVNARTSHGSIKSDVPIATRSAGDDAVVGTIGGGKCRLELANTNGNIRIEKQ